MLRAWSPNHGATGRRNFKRWGLVTGNHAPGSRHLKEILDTPLSCPSFCLLDAELRLPAMPAYEVLLYLGPETSGPKIISTSKAVKDKIFLFIN